MFSYAIASKSSWNMSVYFTGIVSVNKEMHIVILHRLRDAVGFSQGFLSKEKRENSGTSPLLSWPDSN